jgi:hypothetical protein
LRFTITYAILAPVLKGTNAPLHVLNSTSGPG